MHINWGGGSSPGGRARLSTQGGISGVCTSTGGSSPGGYSLGSFSGGVISRGLSPAFVAYESDVLQSRPLDQQCVFICARHALLTLRIPACHRGPHRTRASHVCAHFSTTLSLSVSLSLSLSLSLSHTHTHTHTQPIDDTQTRPVKWRVCVPCCSYHLFFIGFLFTVSIFQPHYIAYRFFPPSSTICFCLRICQRDNSKLVDEF